MGGTCFPCRLRDELMDDVADFLDDMPEEQRNTLSYGQLLSKVTERVSWRVAMQF